jgi:hypothetical protein
MAFFEELESLLVQAGWADVEIETGDLLLPGLPSFCTPLSLWLEARLAQKSIVKILGQSHFIRAQVG